MSYPRFTVNARRFDAETDQTDVMMEAIRKCDPTRPRYPFPGADQSEKESVSSAFVYAHCRLELETAATECFA